jgi:LysM repeat protein
MAIVVPIVSTFNDKGIKNANKQIGGFDKTVKTLGKSFAGVFAAQKIVTFFASSVKGALADQKAQVQLANSIRNTTNATNQQIRELENYIQATSFATGVSDEQLRPAINRLVLATGDLSEAQKLSSLAMDISAGTGRDLESVTTALAKAAGGQYTSLQRLGVGLSKSVLETKDLDKITGVLADKFQGQAAAAAGTLQGKMEILKVRVEEAKEEIGFGLITAVNLFSDPGGAADEFGSAITTAGEDIAGFAVGVADVTKEIYDMTNSFIVAAKAAGYLPESFNLQKLIAAIPVIGGLVGGYGLLRDRGKEIIETNKQNALTTELSGERYQQLAKSLGFVIPKEEEFADAVDKATKKVKGLSDAQKALINSNIKLQESVVNNLQESLSGAESSLDSIKSKFEDLRDTIGGSVTDVIDFGAAIESESFLQTITNQANNAKTFAEKVKQLIQLGLSERGIREILDTGFEAGSLIADQLIAGGATIVSQVNTLLDSVNAVATTVGELGAKTFYQQGVDQGEALVAGIKSALESAKTELDRLRESLTGTTTTGAGGGAPGTTPSGTGAKTVVVKPGDTLGKIAAANNISLKSILDANAKFTTDPKYKGGSTIFSGTTVKIPKFAKGGIVNSPTIGMIGEAGPEAIVPLSGSNAGIGATYNIVVNAGIGTSGSQVGREIVDAIKKFEKTSGPVFASA